MRTRRGLATGLTMLALLGLLSAVRGQKEEPGRRPLDPQAVAVRLLLGVGDRQEQAWGGRVETDKGEVVGVEGWRFRDGDRVSGANSWEARSRPSAAAKQALAKKGANVKKKGNAAKKAQGAGGQGGAIVPNGVVATLKAPEDARLAVHTEHGDFTVALADLADGSPRRFLDGRVEVQRVPPSVVLLDGPAQEDFPSAAADARGTLWVAYVAHEPRGPATLPALKERPKEFASYVPKGGATRSACSASPTARPATRST